MSTRLFMWSVWCFTGNAIWKTWRKTFPHSPYVIQKLMIHVWSFHSVIPNERDLKSNLEKNVNQGLSERSKRFSNSESKGYCEAGLPLDEKFDTEHFSDFSAKTLEGSFSAVSTPIFASKYSFCSVFRDLQDCHTFAPVSYTHLTLPTKRIV